MGVCPIINLMLTFKHPAPITQKRRVIADTPELSLYYFKN